MKYVVDSDIEEIFLTMKPSLEKLSGKTIVITGAAGFLGRYFLSVFARANQSMEIPIKMIGIDNYITSNEEYSESNYRNLPNLEWIYGDALIASQLPNKFDYILHAAGIASPQHYRANPLLTIDVTINVTRSLLERAKTDNSRMIFFSSSEIYGDPAPEFVPTSEDYRGNVSVRGPRACYDESKRLGETLCWIYQTYYDTKVFVVRPFNVYGPGMMPTDYRVLPNFAASIKEGNALNVYGDGLQTRTFCYVTDAIIGFLKVLLDAPAPDVFNIGNPKPEISMLDLVQEIGIVLGRKIELTNQDYPESYPADEPNRRCPNITKAQSIINFQPKVSLNEGLSRFFDWTSKNY
jgi:UDP-glucuronate decarboxylase